MDSLFNFIVGVGKYLYDEEAVFETLCLFGVLIFALLTLRETRKTKLLLKQAIKNFAEVARLRGKSSLGEHQNEIADSEE